MSEQENTPLIRRCDVAVVGGSAAGLAAALQIQRQNRAVIVIDSGEPRNAPAAHMHAYLGYDGAPPSELTGTGRSEVRRYGGEILNGRVNTVRRQDDRFLVEVGDVHVLARRVVAATGATDELPPIEGIADHWGDTVIHCPFCHGYEVRGQQIVQVITHPAGFHPAHLFTHLSDRLTLVIQDDLQIDGDEIAAFQAGGVEMVRGTVRRLVEGQDGGVVGVELADGARLAATAVVVTPPIRPRIEPFRELGLTTETHPIGIAEYVETDETGETSVSGLYAAGNLTGPAQQVLAAAADGSLVGAMVARDLAMEDLTAAGRETAGEAEWNDRYSGDEVWSGSPNGTLVAEVASLSPGRALDIGAGEGGDARWLAEQGWNVTATDVADAGLRRLATNATVEGFSVRCLTVDANAAHAFGDDTYDLVSLFYSAIPRTGDDRAITNIMNAVAPGGTLLMVGHAPSEPNHGATDDDPAETPPHTFPWDRESFVGIDHLEAAVRAAPGWTVVASELRERPPGSSTHHHHSKDVVFRALRNRT
ncbi:MAG: bifunctional NAD(P)/FAD-dependent oxidoreductase/class I SAM-dependent methyltransferase [Actinomycetota bacterium]